MEEFLKVLEMAKKLRTTKKTKMNDQSSRSHSILQITLENIDSSNIKSSPKSNSKTSLKGSPIKDVKKNTSCQFFFQTTSVL